MAESDAYKRRTIRQAATVMHAWYAGEDDGDISLAIHEVSALIRDGAADMDDLAIGLTNLSGLLMVKLEQAGVDPTAFLQEVIARYSD